jgi:hypothetical protein
LCFVVDVTSRLDEQQGTPLLLLSMLMFCFWKIIDSQFDLICSCFGSSQTGFSFAELNEGLTRELGELNVGNLFHQSSNFNYFD